MVIDNAEKISRVRYYYHNSDVVGGNVFTACLFLDDHNNILARGVAIKSVSDQHSKEEGRRRAYKRAMKALCSGEDSCPINHSGGKRPPIWRQQKLKTVDQKVRFLENVVKQIKLDDIPQTVFNRIETKKGELVRYLVPYLFPVIETRKFFSHKSSCKPLKTPFEEKLLEPKNSYVKETNNV